MNKQYIFFKIIIVSIIVSIGLLTCASTKNDPREPLTVTILHINDTHSYLEPSNYDIILGGRKTRVPVGGFPQTISVIREQQKANPDNILLHAGDAITGTIYYSMFKGTSDAEMMNQLKWDAFALGNHEFDDGNEVLKDFLDKLEAPTVAANVIPDESSILAGAWEPYTIVEVKGQRIGIIGIDIVGKTKNSSNPGDDINFEDETATTKKYVEILEKQGINKIIVLSHIGHDNAKTLASNVSGIDIIVNGDSHSLLGGDEFESRSLSPEDSYPTMVTSPSNEPIAIVQAWEYTKMLGKLEVEFDEYGVITNTTGTPILILSDSFKRKNSDGKRVELEGSDRDAIYTDISQNPYLALVESDPTALEILSTYKEEKDVLAKEVIATVFNDIPGGSAVRIPKKDENNPDAKWGHFTAQIVADGMLHKLRNLGTGKVDAIIQNAGGVRIPLVQGDLNTETVYTLLPFSNTLVTIQLTGSEIKTALEQSIDFALNPDNSTGSFPYTSAMRFSADLEARAGQRVSDIEMEVDGKWVPIDANKTYIIGANNYIAGGKDGYIVLGEVDDSKKIDTYINDAQAFMDYVQYLGKVKKPERTNVTLK